MTKSEAAKAFLELSAQPRHEKLLGNGAVQAALRGEGQTIYLAELSGADMTMQELAADGANEPFLAAFSIKPEAKAVLLLAGNYALKVANSMKSLIAELDDMAQIVGLTARTASTLEQGELTRCLKNRNSCFVRGAGMLVTGRSLSEAITGAILLEKAAMTHILAQKIGGAKRVPLFSAALMHYIYQKKYSKINLNAETQGKEQTTPSAQPERSAREQKLREDIIRYGNRLVEEGLSVSDGDSAAARAFNLYLTTMDQVPPEELITEVYEPLA